VPSLSDLAGALPLLLPKAIAWAESQERRARRRGRLLSPGERALAVAVGVAEPERVRVLLVAGLPEPFDAALRAAGREAGLLGPGMTGMTLGHAVFLRPGPGFRRTLSHELRHVAQYEENGGIAGFLPAYLRQVLEFGYSSAPLEDDARRHEAD
jgi:hypothetical protein